MSDLLPDQAMPNEFGLIDFPSRQKAAGLTMAPALFAAVDGQLEDHPDFMTTEGWYGGALLERVADGIRALPVEAAPTFLTAGVVAAVCLANKKLDGIDYGYDPEYKYGVHNSNLDQLTHWIGVLAATSIATYVAASASELPEDITWQLGIANMILAQGFALRMAAQKLDSQWR